MDKIIIKGLRVSACHGVNQSEKESPQPFIVDAVLHADLTAARESDDLNDTVNYAAAAKAIRDELLSNSYDLIERAADCIAKRLLRDFDKIAGVEIMLKKPRAPMSGDFEYVAVSVSAGRIQ